MPAFDRFFRVGLGVTSFGSRSLATITAFYAANADAIEACRVPTLDFTTGEPTGRRYTRAKVIDLVFFIEGAGTGVSPAADTTLPS